MLFRLPKGTAMTEELLQEFLNKHSTECKTRFEKLKNDYESNHDILRARAKEKYKPDNRIVVNFAKYITDTFEGFFMGNPVKTIAEEDAVAEYVEHIEQYNDQDDNNAELSKLMSIYGGGFEVYFTDENSELCITYLSPLEAFMVYDDTIVERPMYFVHRFTDYEGNEWGCLYDSALKRPFKITGGVKFISELEEAEEHNFPDVPATEFIQNAERQGIFEPVRSMANAYNKAVSEKANDVDYFADAYLKILGVKLEGEDIQTVRDNRIINFEGDGADKIIVEFMGKPESDTAQENLLNRLERLIFQNSLVANISDENFGTSSGIALKYKLLPMTNLGRTKERKFISGMNRRYKLLFGHPLSKVPADAWMNLKYQFTFNMPANLLEEAQIAAQMEGIVSHETQLKVLSIVDNVHDEMDKIAEENEVPEMTDVESTMFGNQIGFAAEDDEEVIDDEQ